MTNEDDIRWLIENVTGFAERNPHLVSIPNPNHNPGKATVVEPDPRYEPLAASPIQKANQIRFRVCVVAARRKLLDSDNQCEKFLVDRLRNVGAIPDDSPEFCDIETSQRYCEKGEPEHIEILVERI